MKIVDLTVQTIDDSINLCIGSKPGDEQAREEKRRWLESRMPLRAGGKLAYQDGNLAGMVEFTPIEDSPFPVTGVGLLHINCLWVLPRHQRRGLGKGLLKSCVQEAGRLGMKGVSVVADDNPVFMPSSFFLHQGFLSIEQRGHEELMLMDLKESRPPRFIPAEYFAKTSGNKVLVDVLYCSQCPWSVKTRSRIEKVAREFGHSVQVRCTRTDTRAKVEEMGDSRKILVDGKEVFLPTPTEDDVRKVLTDRITERKLAA